MSEHPLSLLIRRLRSVAALPLQGAPESVLALKTRQQTFSPGASLYRPGAMGLPCYVVLRGSAIRYKTRDDGTRAIVGFELPGDIINLEALLLRQTDCGATAATEMVVATVPLAAIMEALQSDRSLEAAFWRYACIKAAALEEWLLNIGKRSPVGRVAHLLMELRSRLLAIDDGHVDADAVHVTMRDIADAMGLQEVVATRIVHDLASQGLVRRAGDVILIQDAARLAKVGEFRPDYLHMAVAAS